jgi:vacuolar-type H+-ATPase subunit F/Vma7
MRLFVIGTLVDVTGFALAGIDGVVCTTAGDVKAALEAIAADAAAAVVFVSPTCVSLASDEIEAFRARHEMPMLVVLPGARPDARAAAQEGRR